MIVGRVLVLLLLVVVDVEADGDRDVALQLFDPLHYFELGGSVEDVARAPQEELEVLRHIATTDVDSLDGIVDREAFEDWTAMANAVAAVQDHAGRLTTSIQAEHGLLLEENLRRAKFLEENVCCLDPIAVWIEWWLCQKNGMLLGRDLELIEDVSPQLLHVVPVLNNSVLNWIVELEDSSVFVSCITNECVLLVLSDHDFLVNWSADI